MKKQLFSVLSFLMLCLGLQAQTNIANYTFASSVGTYVPLTGATTFTNSWDNEISASIPLGGNFTFGATTHTACFISGNGYITFGAAPAGTNYTALSTLGTTSAAISAFSQDGSSSTAPGATPSISYMNIGGASGEFVVQYTDHSNWSNRTTERLNFQIRLNLSTGAINIIYGSWTVSGSSGTTAQVGIRGNSTTWSTNVNNLNTVNIPSGNSCSWADAITSVANNSSMYFNSANTAIAPSNGLTFTWMPPVNPSLAPVRTFSAVASITANSANISWTAPTSATQYNVQYRQNTSCSWTNFAGNPVSTTSVSLTGLTASTVYQIRVQSSDGVNNAIWSHIPNQAGTGGGYNTTAGTFSTLALPTDLQTSALTAPAINASGCYGSSIPVVIQLKNAGTALLDFATNNATVLTSITGTNPQSFTTTVNTGTLAAGATLNVTVTSTYNMSAVGVYTINASSTLATPDANTTNDFMAAVTRTTTAALNIPIVNGFNGFTGANLATVFPGWSEATGATIPSGTTSGWINQTGLNGTGNITAKINLFSNTANEWILTPKFAVTSGVNLIFDAAITDYNLLTADPTGMAGTDDKVQVMVSTDCGNTFTSLLSITQTNSLTTAFTTFSVNLSAYVGQNVIIGFMASEGTINDAPDYDFHIDNINISNCFAPTNLTTSNITTSSTDIAWNMPITGSPVSYFGEIRTSGAAGSGTLGLVSSGSTTAPTTTANITGLTASTAYTIYLQSNCGGSDVSQWTSVTFTTLANCPVPSALNTSTVLATSANFTWTAGGSETAWDIYYGPQPLTAPTASTAPTATSSATSYSATGLTQTTAYAVYVRANCGAGNTSVWTAVKNFTTPVSCPMPSSVTVSSINPTSAVASWVAGSTESSWLVRYMAPTTTVVVNPSPSYSLTSLSPNTNYSVQVKAICGVADSSTWTTLSVFSTPCLAPNILTTTPGSRCGVGTTTLAATGDAGATLQWYANPTGGISIASGTLFTTPSLTSTTNYYVSAGNVYTGSKSIGNGGSTGISAPYNITNGTYGGLKGQYLFTAAELNAAGLTAGNITNLAFELTATGSVLNGFVVEVGNTSLTTFATSDIQGGLTMVSPATSFTPAIGLNTINFSTPFNWNGTSNIIVSLSWSNNNTSNSSSTIKYDATSNFASLTYRKDSETAINMAAFTGSVGAGTSTFDRTQTRPKFTLTGNAICESPRSMVTASINTAPVLSVSNGTTICTNAIQTLSITSSLSNYDIYNWTPISNLYTDASATTSYTGGNASTLYYKSSLVNNTTYSINANNTVSGCANASTLSMASTMPDIFASANPTILCSGSTVSLTANTSIIASGNVTLGTGTLVTSGSGAAGGSYISPYSHYYGGYKSQYIIRASELQTAGLTAGNITALSLNVSTAGTTYSNFAISMASTSQSIATTTFDGSVSQVYTPTNVTPSVGLNTYNFTTPFNWNGTSNIIVQICWSNNNTGGTAAEVIYSPTSYASTSYYRVDNNTSALVCGQVTASGTINNRPNIILAGQKTTTGAGTVTWQWNPGAINSNTTTVIANNTGSTTTVDSYTVTALDPATTCTNSAVVNFSVLPIPVVTASASNASVCAGSSATLTASGATNYTWTAGGNTSSQVVSPSTASTYTVTGETSGCSNTATVSLAVTATPTVFAMTSNSVVCAGSSATLTAMGATNYTWSTGSNGTTEVVTPTVNTTYTLTGEDNGCSTQNVVSVNVNALPVVNAIASQTLLCDDGSTGAAILTASTSATSYAWSDGATTMTTAVTPTITTDYTVTVTENGCSADAVISIMVSNCNGVKELIANGIAVYPNPTNGILNISISSELAGNTSIEVYDAIGKLAIKETLSNNTNTINLSQLEDGIYVFKVINNNKAIKIGKVVKQ